MENQKIMWQIVLIIVGVLLLFIGYNWYQNVQDDKRRKESDDKWQRYYNNQQQSQQSYAKRESIMEGRPLVKPNSQPSSCGGYLTTKQLSPDEDGRRDEDSMSMLNPLNPLSPLNPIYNTCGSEPSNDSPSHSSGSDSSNSSSSDSSSSSCGASSCGSSCGGGGGCSS